MSQTAWKVMVKETHVDTVWFDSDMTKDDVYRSLVNDEGFSDWIKLERIG